jgi:hypothetical protein
MGGGLRELGEDTTLFKLSAHSLLIRIIRKRKEARWVYHSVSGGTIVEKLNIKGKN